MDEIENASGAEPSQSDLDDLTGARGPPPSGPSTGKRPCGCGARGRHRSDCPEAGTGARSPSAAKSAGVARKTDAEWLTDVGAAYTALWFVIRLIAKRLGYVEKAPLTKDEAEADARVLAPIVRDYTTLIKIMNWFAAPIVLIRRISDKFERKPKTAGVPENAQPLRSGLVKG